MLRSASPTSSAKVEVTEAAQAPHPSYVAHARYASSGRDDSRSLELVHRLVHLRYRLHVLRVGQTAHELRQLITQGGVFLVYGAGGGGRGKANSRNEMGGEGWL